MLLFFGVGSILSACGEGVEQVPQATIPSDRVVNQVAWDTTLQLGGALKDTLLLIPRRFAARGQHLYVFDYGDTRLKAFHVDGRVRWTFGREGEGPEEFKHVVDMEIDSEGAVWLLDAGVGRITIVGPDGRFVDHIPLSIAFRHIPLGPRPVRDILPLSGDTLATSFGPGDGFLVALSASGDVTDAGPVPAPEIANAFYHTRAPLSFIASDSPDEWIVIFPFGDLWFVYDGRVPRCTGQLVEGGGLPTEPPQNPENQPQVWALGAALDDSFAYILPKGRTDDAQRVLDRYSAHSCEYRGSISLPRKIRSFVLSEGIFYVEYADPAPTILGIRARH
jgi:hypothetical protein